MKKTRPRKGGRSALTKAMLLPLPTDQVRALSLETHMALALMRSGNGRFDQMLCLLRAAYMAFFLHDDAGSGADPDLYRRADDVLAECNARAERGEPWLLLDDEAAVLEQVLIVYDAQLAAVSRHRYRQAWARLHRFVANHAQSPVSAEEATV
ncbi:MULTISPECIES: hypothetical protein [Burkholderia]|uniref:hypothetical protein n=1 Tax=Burkholderia TaxID=32008 RepID=UPI000504D5AD|nr:hypothetical protein [Burkholderia pyrrocinia]KFL52264.1 hypothetical protein JM78_17090 [Burkholderia pyrrocinia]